MEGDDGEGDKLVTVTISIHALRVEGDKQFDYPVYIDLEISIHALRVEGDPKPIGCFAPICISIHALRVEGDISLK